MQIRTPLDLCILIPDQRRRLMLDQSDLAATVGVNRKWIIDIEKGKPRAEIGLVLRTLDALGLRISLDGSGEGDGGEVAPVDGPDLDRVLDRTRRDTPQ